MLSDAHEIPSGSTITTDVCIIGAGAAGITLAREFIGQPFRVCLLESGGLSFDSRRQSLNSGTNVGLPYYALEGTRLRHFGGTTNHWGGWCRPLDPIDFEARPWVPHSGWPFNFETLRPYYERAQDMCQLGPFTYEEAFWREAEPPLALDQHCLYTSVFQVSPPTRFGVVYRGEIQQAQNITTYLYANALELETDRAARTVSRIRAASEPDKEFWVEARWVILALGTIENARLLLVSDAAQPNGLGNGSDLVGRFFMEHPSLTVGCLMPAEPALPAVEFYSRHEVERAGRRHPMSGAIALSAEIMRNERLLNAISTPMSRATPEMLSGVASAKTIAESFERWKWPKEFARHLRQVITDWEDVSWAMKKRLAKQPLTLYACELSLEQSPDPESRVTLTDARDRFRQRRVQLNWKVGGAEKRTLLRAWELIGREIGRLGVGRVATTIDLQADRLPWAGLYHQMGTTRMHADPEQGVTDPNSLVHGMSNLYIAGASVFPTSGISNPTLTIVALALRMADRFKQELQA